MADPYERKLPPLSPQLVLSDAAAAIDFYKRAFGATELTRHMGPDGKRIMHGSILINGAVVMLSDEFPDYHGGKRNSPVGLGGTTVVLHLQVADADPVFDQAVSAGATVRVPLADQFWGDRYGQVQDPFGHIWAIGAAKKKMTLEEIEKAAASHFAEAK